jgi:hypothetical protein
MLSQFKLQSCLKVFDFKNTKYLNKSHHMKHLVTEVAIIMNVKRYNKVGEGLSDLRVCTGLCSMKEQLE